jgi:hypothetical protein
MQLSADELQCGLVVKNQNTQHTGHARAKSSGMKVEPSPAQEEYVNTLLQGKPTAVAKNKVVMYAIQEGITTLQTMHQVDNYITVRAWLSGLGEHYLAPALLFYCSTANNTDSSRQQQQQQHCHHHTPPPPAATIATAHDLLRDFRRGTIARAKIATLPQLHRPFPLVATSLGRHSCSSPSTVREPASWQC